MSNWSYVALAFGVAWTALILYALLLARRVSQAQRIAQTMRAVQQERTEDSVARSPDGGDSPLCDAPPAP